MNVGAVAYLLICNIRKEENSMEVNGTMKVKVDISPSEAIKVIENYLGLDDRGYQTEIVLLPDCHHANKCGKRALYDVTDTSYHGSSHDEYRLVTSDEEKIAIYEAYELLQQTVNKRHEKPLFPKY